MPISHMNSSQERTFTDIARNAADLSIDHLLVQPFDVERLNSEGQRPCQHGECAHASADTHTHTHRKCEMKITHLHST